ncbi:succinate dehydrogenase assembly factor mitochondrial-like [Brachionus plicatilis]|uniref:Succinate dehydrogenase assembly factor 2, mitochondrial n=1 Tax=Brachionus plicatilis TaxID=10195 RepID=A0A3M7Q633_BRAPC|nr:succinate dehydrogenase assembly factor mitochondrial-like [Brachionus plicatilis]
MNRIVLGLRKTNLIYRLSFTSSRCLSDRTKLTPEELEIEQIKANEANRSGESLEEKRSRLIYQSRKRGTLENGLLLSHFSAKYLPGMDEVGLNEFDKIINGLYNEWDLYYWLTGATKIPEDIECSKIFQLMKQFTANQNKESRITQPDL